MAHFQGKPRQRDVGNRATQLEKLGRKVSAVVESDRCQDLAVELYEIAGVITLRQTVFEKVRTDFGTFAVNSSEAESRSFFAGPLLMSAG